MKDRLLINDIYIQIITTGEQHNTQEIYTYIGYMYHDGTINGTSNAQGGRTIEIKNDMLQEIMSTLGN